MSPDIGKASGCLSTFTLILYAYSSTILCYNSKMKCVYCLQDKSPTAFTKAEHVIPQSFDVFKNNLTLIDLVCDDCNQLFGNIDSACNKKTGYSSPVSNFLSTIIQRFFHFDYFLFFQSGSINMALVQLPTRA